MVALCSAACSSSSNEAGASAEAGEKRERDLKTNNPFAFKDSDIQKGDDGRVTGGKRSQFDTRTESAYAANQNLPNYMKKSYQKKAWSGERSYETGSYQTSSYGDSGKRTWFGGKKAGEASQVARASGRNYATGSYRTGSANEAGQIVPTGPNAYAESRTQDGWGRTPTVYSLTEYRNLTVGQTKSLLGR